MLDSIGDRFIKGLFLMYIIPNFFLRQRKKGYIGPFKKEQLLPFGGKDTYAGDNFQQP